MTSKTHTAATHRSPSSWNIAIVLRSLIFNSVMVVFTLFFSLTGLLLFWTPFKIRYFYITRWSHVTIFLAKYLCGIRYTIHGKEHLPSKTSIVLCNHQSTWETLFLQTLLPPQCWVLKKELLTMPFFGWALKLLEPIAIDRSKKNSIKELVLQGTAKLKDGRWVVIFPEGTRVKKGQKKRYSRSGAALAQSAQDFPIVPIAHNAGLFWPKNSFLKYPGTIQVFIGKALLPHEHNPEDLTQTIQRWVEEKLEDCS